MSDLGIALAGGAVGAVVAFAFGQIGRATLAWHEIDVTDEEAFEINAQLLIWVDDETLELVREMKRRTLDANSKGQMWSGYHGATLADAKAAALHRYRDREEAAMLALAQLRARETGWHAFWRRCRRRPAPAFTARAALLPFLDRWREPVTRHLSQPNEPGIEPLDRTRRTVADALGELDDLSLT